MTAIILVKPQMGENIGAAARAILNFGLTDLRLVSPRDGWPNEAAQRNASGALEHITPTIFETLTDALHDCHFSFATTARRRDAVKPVYTPEKAIKSTLTRKDQKTAFVFGPERTGLENDDLTLCSAIINIETNPKFSSLNLSQTVLLLSYELNKQRAQGSIAEATHIQVPARHDELSTFLNRLEIDLEERNYFRSPDLKDTMRRNIKNIFTRAEITDQELRTLHGVLSALRGNKKPPSE